MGTDFYDVDGKEIKVGDVVIIDDDNLKSKVYYNEEYKQIVTETILEKFGDEGGVVGLSNNWKYKIVSSFA